MVKTAVEDVMIGGAVNAFNVYQAKISSQRKKQTTLDPVDLERCLKYIISLEPDAVTSMFRGSLSLDAISTKALSYQENRRDIKFDHELEEKVKAMVEKESASFKSVYQEILAISAEIAAAETSYDTNPY